MTIKELLERGAKSLKRAGVPEPELDAGILLETAANVNRSDCYLHPEREVDSDSLHAYLVMLERRCAREPLQHIVGRTEFMGLPFICDGRALIPRQDTETLVELAIEAAKDIEGPEILDLCTGTGCIAVSLSHYIPKSFITGADISGEALSLARENGALNGADIRWLESDMFEGLSGRSFDMIVSNPPYIRGREIENLMPEVRAFDPILALDGGEDGLSFYRILAEQAGDFLKPRGRLLVEIGDEQAGEVSGLLEKNFRDIHVYKDLCRNDRVVAAVKKG